MTATTALTAQNTQGVIDIHHTPPQFVRKQIAACVEDIGVDVIKTGEHKALSTMWLISSPEYSCVDEGMLASAEMVSVAASAIKEMCPSCITVIDPVSSYR